MLRLPTLLLMMRDFWSERDTSTHNPPEIDIEVEWWSLKIFPGIRLADMRRERTARLIGLIVWVREIEIKVVVLLGVATDRWAWICRWMNIDWRAAFPSSYHTSSQ